VNERFWLPGWQVMELLNGTGRTLANNVATIKAFALQIVEKRRKQLAADAASKDQGPVQAAADTGSDVAGSGMPTDEDEGPSDLLSLFMAAKGPDGRPLSTQQLIDTVINFIIAGRDTTAQVGPDCSTRLLDLECMHKAVHV
jgi:cytochrome P450